MLGMVVIAVMSKKIVCSVNNSNMLTSKEINENQFSLLRIRVFSDAVTKHGYKCSLDTLKKCAYTILGKPILVYYNLFKDDFEGHEEGIKQEMPCGFVPKNSKIEFETDENGVTYLVVEAYIWNLYFQYIMDVFKRDGVKDVSVELLVVDSVKKDDYEEMTDFCFTGITLLGENVSPACEGARAEVTKFSVNKYEEAKKQFEQKLYNSSSELDNMSSYLMSENSKEEQKLEDKTINPASEPTPVDNAWKESTVKTKVETHEALYKDDGSAVYTEEEYKQSQTVVEEVSEEENISPMSQPSVEETENNACGDKENNACKTEENACKTEDNECKKEDNACKQEENECNKTDVVVNSFEEKYTALNAEYLELKNSYNDLMQKYSVLEEFKKNKDNEVRTQAIECALNDVSDILDAEAITNWREKSVNFANVDDFKNALKAFAFDVQKEKGVKPVEQLRNAIPKNIDNEDTMNIWSRLEKNI